MHQRAFLTRPSYSAAQPSLSPCPATQPSSSATPIPPLRSGFAHPFVLHLPSTFGSLTPNTQPRAPNTQPTRDNPAPRHPFPTFGSPHTPTTTT